MTTITVSSAMLRAIQIEVVSAAVPAINSASRISSVAYAEDERASEEKMASALILLRRCSLSSDDRSVSPIKKWRTPDHVRPIGVAARSTTFVASNSFSDTRRSFCSPARGSLKKRVPGLLPCTVSWNSGS